MTEIIHSCSNCDYYLELKDEGKTTKICNGLQTPHEYVGLDNDCSHWELLDYVGRSQKNEELQNKVTRETRSIPPSLLTPNRNPFREFSYDEMRRALNNGALTFSAEEILRLNQQELEQLSIDPMIRIPMRSDGELGSYRPDLPNITSVTWDVAEISSTEIQAYEAERQRQYEEQLQFIEAARRRRDEVCQRNRGRRDRWYRDSVTLEELNRFQSSLPDPEHYLVGYQTRITIQSPLNYMTRNTQVKDVVFEVIECANNEREIWKAWQYAGNLGHPIME